MTGRMPAEGGGEPPDRNGLIIAGYILAAILALGGGAWLALHMSGPHHPAPQEQASPSVPGLAIATPTASSGAPVSQPIVALADTIALSVSGDSAGAPQRNQDAARNAFELNKASLLDSYTRAQAGTAPFSDAMLVRIKILPGGTVSEAAVRVSTNPNPSLDAEIANDFSAWNFTPISGGNSAADYPVVFTTDPAAKAALESQLSAKIAGLSPNALDEYTTSPAASPPPTATPTVTPTPISAPPPPPRPTHRGPRPTPKPPKLPLRQKVKQALAGNRKFGRVDCYTSGSTVTIFGKVFDANDKALAERIVRRVPGAGNVIDSLGTDEEDWARMQNQIASQLMAAGLTGVTIRVIGNIAYLGGTVTSAAQKQQAVSITLSAAPVKIGTNLITVLPGSVF